VVLFVSLGSYRQRVALGRRIRRLDLIFWVLVYLLENTP
jgi:hypothetical protein